MHLVLIISSLNSGGAERVLCDLANYWCSRGHQISIVTLASFETQPFYPLDPKIKLIQLNQSGFESSLIKRLKNILRRVTSLGKTIQILDPDAIISFGDVINITMLIACREGKIPVVVSERTHPGHHKLPALYKKLRQIFYPKAAQIVVQTQSVANYFKNLENIRIIPNAVTIPPLTKKSNALATIKRLVSVGRLCPSKGFEILIYVFSNLLQHYQDLTLTIYGEGAERQNLEELITSLNLQEKVNLPGTTQNIHEALTKADLFIFPSRYEGFPNAVCEAMAVGLPVIVSNCSGNVELVRDRIDGRLFPVDDVEALTNITLELLKDPEQCIMLAQNAKQICDRFNPKRVFALWDQAIAEVIY